MGLFDKIFDDVLGIDPNGGVFGTVNDRILDPINDVGSFIDGKIFQPILGVLRPDLGRLGNLSNGPDGVLLNIENNAAAIPVIYGRRRVGCIRRYIGTTGASNEYLHLVLIWSEGEIDAVDTLYLDDIPSTDPKYAGLLRITHHLGADNQAADADLVNDISWWTTAHKGDGVAYTAIRLKYDKNVFRGYPKFTADIRGIKCYDPRTGLTAWTQNPAICARDYAVTLRYGVGLPATDIDDAAIVEAANYCETQRLPYNGASVTRNLYACDGVVDTSRQTRQNLDEILTSCRGFFPFTGGLHTLVLDKAGASEFSFNQDNILGAWSIDWGTTRDRMNRVTTTYANPDKDWQSDTVVIDDPAYRSADAGRLLERKLTLPFTADVYRASDLSTLAMRASRVPIRASFVAAPAAMKCRIGRPCDITHSTPGWNGQMFIVTNISPLESGLVRVSVQEYDATVFDLSLPNAAITGTSTSLPDPYSVAAPTGLALSSGTAELIQGQDGTITPQILLTWDASQNPYIEHYQIEYKKSSSSIWLPSTPADAGAASAYVQGLQDGVSYDVRIRAVNALGFVSAWIAVVNYPVQGKSAPPSDVGGFSYQIIDTGVVLRWFPIGDADRAGYEIREGVDYPTGATVAILSGTSHQVTFLSAGAHTYWLKALDTSGNESANAVSVTVTVSAPAAPTVDPVAYVGDNVVFGWSQPAADFPVVEYVLRYGVDWASGTHVASIKASAYRERVVWSGTRSYWVAAMDAAGNIGAASRMDAVILPPGIPTISQEVIDNNVLLRWSALPGTLPVDHFEIRRGATFATAVSLGEVRSTFHTLFETQAGDKTYWVVAADTADNYGPEASITASVNEPPDYVLRSQITSAWAGTKTNLIPMSSGHLLATVDPTLTIAQHFSNQGWNSPQDQINAGFARFAMPSGITASYEEIIDYGTVLAGTQVTAVLTTNVISGVTTITPTLSVRQLTTDPWTDYAGLDKVFATNFRYIKVRYDFAASGGDDLLELVQLDIKLDVKRKYDGGMTAANAADPGGTVVNFTRSFVDIDSIVANAMGSASVKAVPDFVDVPNPTSFSIYLFDDNGNRVSGLCSWHAEGF